MIHGAKNYQHFAQKLKRDLQFRDIKKLEEEMNEDEDIVTEYI